MAISERLEIAIRHVESARGYLMTLIDGLSEDDWFWTPTPLVTHIAWQVGHLAMAEYGLLLFRQRGRMEIDGELMSGKFRKLFMKGTTPSVSHDDHPDSQAILGVLDAVHRQALLELPTFDGPQLDEGLDPPHAAFATRYGSILFAADHEMLHCGQIGLLRRMMGKAPVR